MLTKKNHMVKKSALLKKEILHLQKCWCREVRGLVLVRRLALGKIISYAKEYIIKLMPY